jgi:hypothetical protein
MFKIHKVRVKDSGYAHIQDILDILGAKRLSSGAYATTYKVSANEVIKVFNDDRGYKRYLDKMSMMKKNSFVPRIGYALEVIDQYKDKWYMVSMEKLIPWSRDMDNEMKDHLSEFRSFVREYVNDDDYEDYSNLTIRDLPKAMLPVAVPRELLSVMEVLKEAHKQGFGYDLHDGNFMVRNNGDIVITDPLVY